MISRLGASDLRLLAAALHSGRIAVPCSPLSLRGITPSASAAEIAAELNGMAEAGASAGALAMMLDEIAAAVEQRPSVDDLAEVVATAPTLAGPGARETAVVVRELFASARSSVLVAGYEVRRGRDVFAALADRMRGNPALTVRLFLDVHRGPGDTSAADAIAAGFLARFAARDWPNGAPLPELYFDPRSLAAPRGRSIALHAKCVVVDDRDLFVSSANFTPAAQERNVELGILLHAPGIAGRVTRLFDELVATRSLRPLR